MIFLACGMTQRAFKDFVDSLNENQLGLRFTFEINDCTIPFLDIYIEKDGRGNLQTSIYQKSTVNSSLLNWESHHPTNLKRGISKEQFLHVRRNCSRVKDYHRQACDLGIRFVQRGYPIETFETAHKHALKQDRSRLLTLKHPP